MMITAGFVEKSLANWLQICNFIQCIHVLELIINPHIIAYNFTVLGNKCPLVRLIYINCIGLYKVKVSAQKWWCCIGVCISIHIY